VEKVEELAVALKDVIRDKDVIVTMGAGNISAVSHALPAKLSTLVTGAPPERRRSQ
jgi:UDP-N-acetylmuramate-alanine ligase